MSDNEVLNQVNTSAESITIKSEMIQFARKKPVEIEFWLFDINKWMKDKEEYPMVIEKTPMSPMLRDVPIIKTLEGEMDVTDGDYIIRGVKGEYYPCKPDIFALTYDIVGD